VKLYDLQISALQAQITVLKETQYDRALALLEGQKKDFQLERDRYEQRIADLEESQPNGDPSVLRAHLTEKLAHTDKLIQSSDAAVQLYKCTRPVSVSRGTVTKDGDCSFTNPSVFGSNGNPPQTLPIVRKHGSATAQYFCELANFKKAVQFSPDENAQTPTAPRAFAIDDDASNRNSSPYPVQAGGGEWVFNNITCSDQ
jgi:hypothetical protein